MCVIGKGSVLPSSKSLSTECSGLRNQNWEGKGGEGRQAYNLRNLHNENSVTCTGYVILLHEIQACILCLTQCKMWKQPVRMEVCL